MSVLLGRVARTFATAAQHFQLPAQGFNLTFVGVLLDLRIFKGPQDMLHIVQSLRQLLDNPFRFLNGFGH
jgi:hypothetical protein